MGIASKDLGGAKELAHTVSFGVTLAVLTNVAQYVYNHDKVFRRNKLTHWQRHGPFYLVLLSVPLVMADLTRHALQDAGEWPSPGSDMYQPNCHHTWGLRCLTWVRQLTPTRCLGSACDPATQRGAR